MKQFALFLIYGCMILQGSCRKRRHGYKGLTNAAKRSKYEDGGTGTSDIISNYATENTPVFWRDLDTSNVKSPSKKTEEEASPGGFELEPDALPNTVGPNENIYGGFPINDVLGGFELPSPETLAVLKAALKKFGPRNEYEAELHHNLENWAYGYEHHALPEYDIKETPPFYVTMLQGLKMAEEDKKKPACGHAGAECGMYSPVFHLNDDQCNTLAGNCMGSKPITSSYEEPCPWKIIEMLFGCKKPPKPAGPVVPGKPDGVEPPAPKPDEPEAPKPDEPKKPGEEKEEKEEGGKPKPIPIQLEEGHATPAHIEKQVQDIKDEAKNSKDESKSPDNGQQYAKLNSQLSLLSFLKSAAGSKQDTQSRTDFAQPEANTTLEFSSAKLSPGQLSSGQLPVNSVQATKSTDGGTSEFSDWSNWSGCSATCGKGSLSRTRTCTHWKCDGKVIDIKECNLQTCPEYLPWSSWSSCDTPCGTGKERRTRKCSGVRCSGISSQERSCFRDPCKANLKLPPSLSIRLLSSLGAPWGKWSDCTSKCGFGVQVRKRDCKAGNCNFNTDLVQSKTCLRQSCGLKGEKPMSENVRDACLYIHNSYRLSHGVGELAWKDYLADSAGKTAKELASKSASVADIREAETPGTSIILMPTGDFSDVGLEAVCYAAGKAWYAEQKNYDFENPHLAPDNMHFTQMIWKGTHNVGFGAAVSKQGNSFYFVAKYDPPGNQDTYVGFRKNALPLQSSLRIDDSVIVKRLK